MEILTKFCEQHYAKQQTVGYKFFRWLEWLAEQAPVSKGYVPDIPDGYDAIRVCFKDVSSVKYKRWEFDIIRTLLN